MEKYARTIVGYVKKNRHAIIDTSISVIVLLVIVGAIVGIVIHTRSNGPTYQAVNACKALTAPEAQSLLGKDVITHNDQDSPVVSDDTAVSKCSYTDKSAMEGRMKIAAVVVRSAVNNKGIKKNKSDFAESRSQKKHTKTVKELGGKAYFDADTGQLNVLAGRSWYIFNYGYGEAPQANTLKDQIKLARVVLH